ncbi:DUF1615 family protein [archaeon]|jgi:hypothetical protein|nr:DUF1615 family protein [archaeon]MBT4417014.1 DUF1615 family protein [archaeon]
MNRRQFLGIAGGAALALVAANEIAKSYFDQQDTNSVEACFEGLGPDVPSLERKIEAMKDSRAFPRMNDRVDSEAWSRVINSAYMEANGESLENEAYQNLILTIMYQEAGLRSERRATPFLFVTEDMIPGMDNSSFGPMQVKLLSDFEGDPESMEDILVYSMQRLDKVVEAYGGEVTNDNLQFLFGDWVAGDYACRAAAVQNMLNKELSRGLSLDGDLGPMSKGALKQLNDQYNLGMDREEIDSFEIGDNGEFFESEVYRTLVENFAYVENPVLVEAHMTGIEGELAPVRGVPGNSQEYVSRALEAYDNIGGLQK